MSRLDAWRYRLHTWMSRKRFEENLDAELDFHRQLETARQLDTGLSPEEARFATMRKMGSTARYKDEVRRAAGLERLDSVRQDIQFAWRGLKREPLFASFIILTLALGIGANSSIFSVVDRLLLRGPDHVVDPHRLVRFYQTEQPRGQPEYSSAYLGYAAYTIMARETPGLEGAAAYSTTGQTSGAGIDARPIQVSAVTASFFPLLGIRPERGRFFTSLEDTTTGAQHVAVIANRFWRSVRGKDPAILGKAIDVGGEQYTIIGVAPAGFTGAELEPVDVWIPMSLLGARVTDDWTTTWTAQWLRVIGRIRPGASRGQVEAQATRGFLRANREADSTSRYRMSVAPLSADTEGKDSIEARVSRWLVGVTALVLLIACANVVNLLLARTMRRHREVAVRLALGAGQGRLIRLFLIEGLMLSAIAGVLSLAVAWGLGKAIRTVFLPDIEWSALPVDGRVLGITGLVALGTGILVGIVPAIRLSGSNLTTSLKTGIREGGGRHATARQFLTAGQTAISVVLLVGAGLFVQSLRNIENLDLGIEPEHVLAVSVSWPSRRGMNDSARALDRASETRFYRLALERVSTLVEVERASLSVGLPFRSYFSVGLNVPGWDSIPRVAGGQPNISAITSDYFSTVGTPVLRGRQFAPSDREGSEPVAIVSDLMARTLWPGRDPLNQCLLIGEDSACSRVVGVVGDVHRHALREPETMHYYIPMGQEHGFGGTTLLVRPKGSLKGMEREIRRALLEENPGAGYIGIQSMQEIIDPQVRPWRLGATVFSLAGLLALLVAAVGLYSVLSYLIAQRKHEIGIRLALGARASSISALILRSSLSMVAAGIVIGTIAALIGSRYVGSLLFDTSPRDTSSYLIGAGTLVIIALLACLPPAHRANRIRPMEALRSE
ncbi:MAG: ABC transporter permease [Gemmatimonadota bacterium]